jgi:hypothetical protein
MGIEKTVIVQAPRQAVARAFYDVQIVFWICPETRRKRWLNDEGANTQSHAHSV